MVSHDLHPVTECFQMCGVPCLVPLGLLLAKGLERAFRGIAEAVGKNVGVPAEGVSLGDAYAKEIWPEWVTSLFVLNQRADSSKATRVLGWGDFKQLRMLSDIESGSYAASK